MSCDRCKSRKIRCIRLQETAESVTGTPPCAACVQVGLRCESSLPRKTRTYGNTSRQHRLGEALLRAIFPGRDLSADGLKALLSDRGISWDETSERDIPLSPIPDAHETGPLPHRLPVDGEGDDEPGYRAVPPGVPDNLMEDRIPEGRLIPAPRGGLHYVGAASSFQFTMVVRQLVARCPLPAIDDSGFRRFLKTTEFTSFNTSRALEARMQGNPASAAADDTTGDDVLAQPVESQPAAGMSLPDFGFSPSEGASPLTGTGRTRPTLAAILPIRPVCDALLDTFFARVHNNFGLFHRATFQMRLDMYRASTSLPSAHGQAARANDEADTGWVCCVLLVLAFAAQVHWSTLGDPYMAALEHKCISVVHRHYLNRLSMTASLSNVQAFMLLSLYQHNAGERNTAWMTLGQAGRMALALGLHRDGENGNFDTVERNVRRLVWWTLHIYEENLASALGRPASTGLPDVSTRLPEEYLLDGGDYPSGFLQQFVALSQLTGRIRRFNAIVSGKYNQPIHLLAWVQRAEELLQLLYAWRDGLPQHLRPEHPFATTRHRRAVLLMQLACDQLRSMIGRPFCLCRADHQIRLGQADQPNDIPPLAPSIDALADEGRRAARAMIDHLLTLSRHGILEGETWLDFLYAHEAIFITGLCFLGKGPAPGSSPWNANSVYTAQDEDDRRAVSEMIAVSQRIRLAPTYRILAQIDWQFAFIVGIGPDSAPESPLPGEGLATAGTGESIQLGQARGGANLDFTTSAALNSLGSLYPPNSGPYDMMADLVNFGFVGDPTIGGTGTGDAGGSSLNFFNLAPDGFPEPSTW